MYRYNKNVIILLLYLVLISIFFALDFSVSSLGDYRLYRKVYYPLFSSYSPEAFTRDVFSLLSFISPQFVIGLLTILASCFYSLRNSCLPKAKVSLYLFLLFNPFYIQFFIYESKEFLICCVLLILSIDGFKRVHSFYWIVFSLAFIAAVRLESLLIFAFFILYFNQSRMVLFRSIGVLGFIIVSVLIIASLYYPAVDNYYSDFFRSLSRMFLTYNSASTNRYWISEVEELLSIETVFIFLLSYYTFFFSFLPTENIIAFSLLVPFGIAKIFWFYMVVFKSKYPIILFSFASMYIVPISIYNVGSAMRYQIPIVLLLCLIFFFKGSVNNDHKYG